MKTFLGVGLGPIQTSIFLDGAFRGGFDRLVIADVDAALIQAVRNNDGTIQVNIASNEAVSTETVTGVEIYNPTVSKDIEKLTEAAAQADEIATALPSIAFFKHLEWMKAGFEKQPERRRFVYAAENHNHAAEELEKVLGPFQNTHYLNTVIGKMSCIFPADECARRKIPALTPLADRGHLVEAFNKILIQSCPDIEERQVQGLVEKPELLPFEEAKLYGHNAVHFWLGLHAQKNGIQFMHELADDLDLLARARIAFVEESGAALCEKWAGKDSLFTQEGFAEYADDLLKRMVNPFLTDRAERVCRDLERKLSWADRVVGAMRLVLGQGMEPTVFAEGAALAAYSLFGDDAEKIRGGLAVLWGGWSEEAELVWSWIERKTMKKMTVEELSPYVGSMNQLARVRTSVLDDGKGRGIRIADVDNGTGLRLTVLLERGMDIGEASFKGTPFAYMTPVGNIHPAYFESDGFRWLGSFIDGLMLAIRVGRDHCFRGLRRQKTL